MKARPALAPPHRVAAAPHLRAIAALLGLALAVAACDEAAPVSLEYDRVGPDRAHHVFPTDDYRNDEGLGQLSELALADLPFLGRLRATGQVGYGAATGVRIPFSAPDGDAGRILDEASLADGVRLYRTSSFPATAVPIGELVLSRETNTVTLWPRAPFGPGTYAVAVLSDRLRTRSGAGVQPSRDYVRVQRDGDPVTDTSFGAVMAIDPKINARRDTIGFFQFTVVESTSQLALLHDVVFGLSPCDFRVRDETLAVTPWEPAATRQIAVGAATTLAAGAAPVARYLQAQGGPSGVDTSAIGAIVTGALAVPYFVSDPVFDVAALARNGTFVGRNGTIPFSALNPIVASKAAPSRVIPYLAVLPVRAAKSAPPPIVVALHGFGRAKEDWLALAPALARAGVALVAIDAYQHGARQRDIALPEGGFSDKRDVALAAAGLVFPDPFVNPTFIARTRDKLRQTLVDEMALVRVVSEADGTRPEIDLDGDGVGDAFSAVYVVGQSLGAMLATDLASVTPEVERVALSVPGGSFAQVMADSPEFALSLDLLIYATANVASFGLMPPDGGKLLPESPARELLNRVIETIVSPVDPMSFAPLLLPSGQQRVLVQLAVGDLVVPNDASVRFVRALTAAVPPDALPIVGDDPLGLGLPRETTPPATFLSERVATHGHLLDFAARDVTAAAQAELVGFLTAP